MGKKPSEEDFNIALMWLENNEGGEGEAEACQRVADWLRNLMDDGYLRRKAREAGVPVAKLRQRLREMAHDDIWNREQT